MDAQGAASGVVALCEPMGGLFAVKAVRTGAYVYVNAVMDELFKGARPTMLGLTDADLFRADEVLALRRVDQAVMAQRAVTVSEHRIELSGRRRDFLVTRTPLGADYVMSLWLERTEELQKDAHLQRAMQQIEQEQRALEQMRRELQTDHGRDQASGLYMRAQFDDQLRREIDLSSREHREFALVLITLDPLHSGQYAPGSEAQQRLFEGLGRTLRSNTRAMDAACRVDEDMFAVLLSGVGLATAHSRMEQMRKQCCAQMVVLNGQDLGLSLSVGIASFPHTAAREDELMAASQRAVVDAQRRGGNQVVLASIPFQAPA